MNKEPVWLYIFRLVLSLCILAFMGMLYWSSLLVEDNTLNIQTALEQLKQETSHLRIAIGLLEETVSSNKLYPDGSQSAGARPSNSKALSNHRPHIKPELPNILQEDAFYNHTLPKLLGPDFKPHGNFHNSLFAGKPENLHPFSNWGAAIQFLSLCNVSVAKMQFGKYETMAPDMAIKMELRTNPTTHKQEFWIHLREGVFWEPLKRSYFSEDLQLAPQFFERHPVTAHEFKFWFDALMNPYNQELGAIALKNYVGDIEDIEVIDDVTFVVRWKTHEVTIDGEKKQLMLYLAKSWTGSLKPLASFVYKYFPDGKKILEDDHDPNAYRTSSVWAQNFAQHWAKNIIPSCGPWIFEGMTDQQISFRRNPDYFFPLGVLADAMVVEFKDSPDNVWQDFKANKSDSYNIQPNQLLELDQFKKSDLYQSQEKQGFAIKELTYLARQYGYIGWNEAKPYFVSKKVRQALTMAIDRKRIKREFLNGRAEEITGTFFKNSPSYDASIEPLPFDPQQASRYLEEEGWYDSTGSGIIDKEINGQRIPFRFSLTYYVKAPVTKSICEYIASALKDIGIDCQLNGVDVADLSIAVDDKNFDAIAMAWSLGTPPENPKQLWHSSGAKEKGSSNIIGFVNKQIDEIIEKLEYEYDPKKRIELYHQFDRIIYDEQPYTFLYSPKVLLLYREYLQNVFLPVDRQDLVPGANVAEPDDSIYWLK